VGPRAAGGTANTVLSRVNSLPNDNTLLRVFRNLGLILSGKGLGAVCGLVYLALAARALGTHDFGVLVLIHSYVVVSREVFSFKSFQTVIRYGAELIANTDTAGFQHLLKFTTVLDVGGALFATLIAILALPYVGPELGLDDAVIPLAALYCLSGVLNLRYTAHGVLRLYDRFDLLAKQTLVNPLIRLSGVTFAYLIDAGLAFYLVVWFVADVASGMLSLWTAWRELAKQGMREGMRWSFAGVLRNHRHVWPFAWISNLHSTLNLAGTHLPTLAVGFIIGPTGAGLIKVVQEIASLLSKPALTLSETIYPELSKLGVSEDLAGIRRLILRSALIAAAIALGIVTVTLLWGELILGSVFGSEFIGAYDVLVLMMVAAGIYLVESPLNPAMYAIGKASISLKVKAVTSLVQLGATIYLLKTLGLTGAGFGAVIGAGITWAVMVMCAAYQLKRIN